MSCVIYSFQLVRRIYSELHFIVVYLITFDVPEKLELHVGPHLKLSSAITN